MKLFKCRHDMFLMMVIENLNQEATNSSWHVYKCKKCGKVILGTKG